MIVRLNSMLVRYIKYYYLRYIYVVILPILLSYVTMIYLTNGDKHYIIFFIKIEILIWICFIQ